MRTSERLPVWRYGVTEKEELFAKGLLGAVQRRIHEDITDGKTFTTGTLNFPRNLLTGVNNDTAPEIEAILKKAREDIMVLLRGV